MPVAPLLNEQARHRILGDLHTGNQCAGSLTFVNLGGSELIIILVIVLVLFGGAKLPKLARSLGQAQKEFKDGIKDGEAPSSEDSAGE